jgi:hypothetical protein
MICDDLRGCELSEAASDHWTPAQIRPYQRAGALFCLLAAASVGALAKDGLLPGHDLAQIVPFVIQLIVNGLALWIVAGPGVASGWRLYEMRLGSFLFAYGLGIMGLVLAVDAAFDLTRSNAPALLLIVPGIAGLLPIFIGAEERYAGAEVLNEIPRLPLGPLLAGFGGSVVKQTIGWVLLIAGLYLLYEWVFVLKHVLWSGTSFDLIRLAENNFRDALLVWPVIAGFAFIGVIVAVSTWGPLLRGAFEGLKERLGFSGLTPDQRAIVQERLQRLWDYANAPEQENASIAVLFLPLVPTIALIALGVWLMANSESISVWLFPPPAAAGWSLVVRDSGAMLWPAALLCLVGWSVYRFCTDHWPRALHYAIVSDLQKGPALEPSKVRALRRAISREVRRGEGMVSPQDYLLARRRKLSRRVHIVATVALLPALLIGWRGLANYTRVTEAGFDGVDFFTGRHFAYGYGDVVSVQPQCFLERNNKIAYEVTFRDGRDSDLLVEKDLPASLPALKRIDQRLRRTHAVFEPLAGNAHGLQNAHECVRTLGNQYADGKGFAQIMHAE